MTRMLARKSSTLSSLSVLVVTFLKASPAFLFVGTGTCPCAAARTPNPATTIISFHQSFISIRSQLLLNRSRRTDHPVCASFHSTHPPLLFKEGKATSLPALP